jgi:hypothetical protein
LAEAHKVKAIPNAKAHVFFIHCFLKCVQPHRPRLHISIGITGDIYSTVTARSRPTSATCPAKSAA